MIRLGVLDQSPIRSGGTPTQAVHETLELAQICDRLGYERYWLAEHHSSSGLASASPEILIGQVAARTERIRVGSGGVMLSHYSPLKVAEQFRMLEALFPGRIDLGVGRAPGSDMRTAQALQQGPGALGLESYPDQLLDLYSFLSNDFPDDHPFTGIRAMPTGPTMPELWLLGSSRDGAAYASGLGWPFCFAHFISPEGNEQLIRRYRERFEPSPWCPEPRASMGVAVTVAETHEEAEYLSWSRWVSRVGANRGQRRGVLSPDEAMKLDFTEPELDYIAHLRRRSIYGSPSEVRDRLEELSAEYDVDEFIVVTITYDFAKRVRSYELLAEAFGLEKA